MTGLRVRVGEHVDDLVAALAADLDRHRPDPFEADLIAVASAGQGRWLMQRLGTVLGSSPARTDGIAARIELPTTDRLLRDLEAEVLGIDPNDDPWATDRLSWTMLRAFDIAADEPWFRDIAAHVGGPQRPGRRYATARRFCDLFGRYARWHHELLTTPAPGGDAWQHRLWSLVTEMVNEQTPWERTSQAAERLREDPRSTSLPHHLSLWAPQRLAPTDRDMLSALGAERDVTVWWPTASTHDNHLLSRRLGVANRCALAALTQSADPEIDECLVPEPATLLGLLQRQVRTGETPEAPPPADASIRVHLSHGLDRQIEVLRDVLCDLFESIPDLEPRDVLVCTPQVEDVAPLVRALCMVDAELVGLNTHPVSRLRVQVSDPGASRTNPVLDVLARVMDLATSRSQVGDLLDLCSSPPVAARFRLATEDLELLADLLERAGVRWGIDASSREAFGLEGINQNTWLAGLNRLLLGVAVSERDLPYVSSVLPLEMVDSSDLHLLGATAEIISIVRKAIASFAEPTTPTGWVDRFRELLEHLVMVSGEDGWQLGHARLLLADLVAASGADAPAVGLGDMRRLVTTWLAAHPPRSTFLTGNLTVTTLDGLRHVPHRAVCLVGLDEASFPRTSRRTGDDLLERSGRPEDPHVSLDDRQLFLDALLAARDAFVVVCAGRDQRTNDPRPLPAPVSDLLDAVRTLGVAGEELLVPHALQPYEVTAEPTYDKSATQARRALISGPRVTTDRFATHGLPALPRPQAVTIGDLAAFLRHPAREFLRRRVGSWWGITRSEVPPSAGQGDSEIPIELDALKSWALENRLLSLALAGQPPQAIEEAELRRGLLPPMVRGRKAMAGAASRVGEVLDTVRPHLASPVDHLDVTVDLPSGLRVTGRVPVRGHTIVEATTSRPTDKRLLEPWVRLLLVQAGHPGDWSAVVCAQRRTVTLGIDSPEAATTQLDTLVGLMLDGWDQPLPLPPRLGYALADPRAVVDDPRRGDLWSFDVDETWRLFFDDYGDLARAAEHWGGLDRLAQDTYGPLLRAQR